MLLRFILVLGLCCSCRAQDAPLPGEPEEMWSTVPALEVGTTHVYDLTRERFIKSPEEPARRITGGHEVRITLIEHTDDGIAYRWSARSPELEQAWPDMAEAMALMSPIIELDLESNFVGVRNWEEYRDGARKAIALTLSQRECAEKLDNQDAQTVMEVAAGRYETRELVEFAVASDAAHFFFGYGWEMGADADHEWASETPIGFDATMVPATERLFWDREGSNESRRVLVWQSSVDKDAAAEVLEKAIRDVADQLDVQFDEHLIDLADAFAVAEYFFRPDFGCFDTVRLTRHVELMGVVNHEERVWRLREIIPPDSTE